MRKRKASTVGGEVEAGVADEAKGGVGVEGLAVGRGCDALATGCDVAGCAVDA